MAVYSAHTNNRPRLRCLLVWIVALTMPGALVGCGEQETSDESTATSTASTTTTATTATQTVQDARAAVDRDEYTAALAIATALGATQADLIRRRISNRIARTSLRCTPRWQPRPRAHADHPRQEVRHVATERPRSRELQGGQGARCGRQSAARGRGQSEARGRCEGAARA